MDVHGFDTAIIPHHQPGLAGSGLILSRRSIVELQVEQDFLAHGW